MDERNDSACTAIARFSPGDLIRHNRFGYRGVVVDVDATFQLTDEWYDQVARSRPPKDQPWYHVLVDGADTTTYVAQRHLDREPEPRPIRHPMTDQFFRAYREGRYERHEPVN